MRSWLLAHWLVAQLLAVLVRVVLLPPVAVPEAKERKPLSIQAGVAIKRPSVPMVAGRPAWARVIQLLVAKS